MIKVPAWILCLSLLTSCASDHPALPLISPSQPASEPAPSGADSSYNSPGAFDADGYLQPVDPFEVRMRPKAYTGDLTIVSIAADGANVKAGDVILQIDPDPLNRQLAAAKNDLLVAQANADKTESAAALAVQSDALSLRQQQDETRAADDAVKWWDAVDGPQMLLEAELSLRETKAGVDDQQDELDQLKKMYKSEELTNATADIVVKRAVRALEIGKARLAMAEQQFAKTRSFAYPIANQKPLDAQTAAHIALQQLQVSQAQGAIVRKTELAAAHAALDDAQRKVNDLTSDLANLAVHAPSDGVVAYGPFVGGAFQADAKALRPGEKVPPQQVLLTLCVPGKLAVHLDLPEDKFVQLKAGLPVTIRSTAFSDLKLQGVCDSASRTPSVTQAGPVYTQIVSLHHVDPRLAPGSKVKVHAEPHGDDNAAVGKSL